MGLAIGTLAPDAVRIGNAAVDSIYVGAVKVWPVGPPTGDPLLESRGAQVLAEVAHALSTGLRIEAGVLVEVAVAGTLAEAVKPDGSYTAQEIVEVAVKEQVGVRTGAEIFVEVAIR